MNAEPPGVTSWWQHRLGLAHWTSSLSRRYVLSRHPGWYLGGAALTLLGLQVASGVLLLLHYQPAASEAFGSVQNIVSRLAFGDLLRGIHVHSSNLLVGTVGLLLLVGLWRRAYVPPRELLWLSGFALLVLCVGMAFTGSILPWTREAYLQARVGSQLAGHMPVVGDWVLRFLRGGDEVTTATLQRAFGFHVAVLPATLTALLTLHLLLLHSTTENAPPPAGGVLIPVYPDFLYRLAVVAVGVLVVVISLATFVTEPLGKPFELGQALSETARPAWYLLFMHQLLRVAPPRLLGLESTTFVGGSVAILFGVATAIPFLDRRGSRVTVAVGTVCVCIAALLTAYALL